MKTALNITIHRGTHEIGGTCVELTAGASRIVLDMGMPLVNPDGTEFDSRALRDKTGQELLDIGILPPVGGLYAWQQPSVDGVLISHAHQDHYGFVNHVHPDVPVYLGEGTARLLEVSKAFTPHQIEVRSPVVFQWPGAFDVGAFHVVPHLVDHSAFGAFAFEIEAEGKRIFYTGDFREHGYLGKTLDIIKEKVQPGMDVLMMEGTMLARKEEPVLTEEALAEQATEICRECKKAVLVWQSGQNVSRAVSFYKAARRSNREFVTDFYTAHVLAELGQCPGGSKLPYPGNLPDVRVWYPKSLTDKMFDEGHGAIPNRYRFHKMTKEEMAGKLDQIMLFVRPTMSRDLKLISGLEGSVLIYSLWIGYLEQKNTKRFIKQVKDSGIDIKILHTSGHATLKTLKDLVNVLQPKTLIPIHTFHPDAYASEFGVKTAVLSDGEVFKIS